MQSKVTGPEREPQTTIEALEWLLDHLPNEGRDLAEFVMPQVVFAAVLAYLQLALRHPGNAGPTVPLVRGIVAEMTESLCRAAGASARVRQLISAGIAPSGVERRCRVCGCTDDNCARCVIKTGEPCFWIEPDLCSACIEEALPGEDRIYRPGD